MAPNTSCYCYKLFNYLVNKPYQNYHRSVLMNYGLLSINSVLDKCILPRYIGTSQLFLSEKKFQPITKKGIVRKDGTVVKVNTRSKEVPQIRLIDEKGSISVVTMESAKKLAEKKGLVLVDATDERPHAEDARKEYKMQTAAQSIGFERQDDNRSKRRKLLMIKSSIYENDLNSRANIIKKNVAKGHDVRVILMEGDETALEKCFNRLYEKVKDTCDVKNKAKKGDDRITFEVTAPSVKKEKEGNTKKTAIRDAFINMEVEKTNS